jgi:uracil phosphoribosyltransferase
MRAVERQATLAVRPGARAAGCDPKRQNSTQQREGAPVSVTVIDHPMVQHKLILLRNRETSAAKFRLIAREISLLMAYEVPRELPMQTVIIETPLEPMEAPQLAGKKLCFVPVLRAGNGILDGMLDLVPSARVGHIGLYRDPQTLVPVEYYV